MVPNKKWRAGREAETTTISGPVGCVFPRSTTVDGDTAGDVVSLD